MTGAGTVTAPAEGLALGEGTARREGRVDLWTRPAVCQLASGVPGGWC